ncbi:hypothetical protein Taro_012735 [Colocasia esculenta]|uniref:Phytocyanin domain-containing protein n=1 Tax=Colocasia esculenta TaxID=4460 RepID=A0A843UDM0_COLES|nr:hypothetical protein [Colocasia esculenta]
MARAAAVVALVVAACFFRASAQAANYTVGGHAGWIFDSATNKPAANYASWASKQKFFLGDYLIFQTNANSTVIQTYNKTTYGLCSLDQDYGNLTTQWTPFEGADGGSGGRAADAIAVPLTVNGENYYFSSTGDGIQCRNGMKFHITVAHGSGLPPALNQPPPPPPTPATPPPLSPIDATPSSQSETFYNGAPARGGSGPLAIAFSVGFLLLEVLPLAAKGIPSLLL